MSVYIDNLFRRARVGRLVAVWSHLTADTTDELHAFAARLGLRPSWFQPAGVYADTPGNLARGVAGKPRPGARDHYDITMQRRGTAIALGAVEVKIGQEPWRQRRRKGGPS